MSELLTTKEILVALDNIIKKAEKYICIFTYNIKIDPNYLARLRNADKRGVKITVVFGVDNGDDKILQELQSMSNCTVYFKEYLHAKFYYNEKELLVGSMNLSEASAKNNFELGVLFYGEEYLNVIRKVKEEAKEIILDSALWKDRNKSKQKLNTKTDNAQKPPQKNKTPSQPEKKSGFKLLSFFNSSDENGFCIRCGDDIEHDPSKPLCIDCYHEWVEWENEYYQENYCHSCGKEKKDISFAKPECYICYNS